MDRAERIGLGIAVAGHVVLFGLLSVGFLATPNPIELKPSPIDVSLVDEIGLEAAAPQAVEPPAPSVAPDVGPPEDAAPPAETAPPEPVPAPPQPQPEPAPAPKPAPKAPAPKPEPKKAAPEKPSPKQTPPKREATSKASERPAQEKSTGSSREAAPKARPRGSRLGDDFLKGIADTPSQSKSQTPRAARIDARALAGIQDAIRRQIQPCADRQVNPGPGANEIVTTLNLRLNRDGTLASTPTVVRQTGVNESNERYRRRVIDLGIAAFKGCSPLRLPPEYYETANGGWSNINYNWQLR